MPALSVSAPAVTALDDIGLKPQTNYCYTISAEDVSGNESDQSTQVCTATGTTAPPMPTGLTATGSAAPAAPTITLRWTTTAGAASYKIYRDGTLLLSPPLTFAGSQATDATVAALTYYCYVISAVDAAGNESARSDPPVCAATQ